LLGTVLFFRGVFLGIFLLLLLFFFVFFLFIVFDNYGLRLFRLLLFVSWLLRRIFTCSAVAFALGASRALLWTLWHLLVDTAINITRILTLVFRALQGKQAVRDLAIFFLLPRFVVSGTSATASASVLVGASLSVPTLL
jgi:hypothetical protein